MVVEHTIYTPHSHHLIEYLAYIKSEGIVLTVTNILFFLAMHLLTVEWHSFLFHCHVALLVWYETILWQVQPFCGVGRILLSCKIVISIFSLLGRRKNLNIHNGVNVYPCHTTEFGTETYFKQTHRAYYLNNDMFILLNMIL